MGNRPRAALDRRDFIKYSMLAAMAAGTASLPVMTGCATPGKNVPRLDYKKTLYLKNCHVIDVLTGGITRDATITVLDGKIAAITGGEREPAHDPVVPEPVVIDLDGRYVTPGLIDAHCHATASPVFSMSMFDLRKHAKQQKDNYILCVAAGITTIRDMGAFEGLMHRFINHIEAGDFPGPRVVYCNSMLNVKGSHPEIPPSDINLFAVPASWFFGMIMNNFEGTEEMEKCLRKNARGASFVKLTMDDKTLFCKKNKSIPVYTDEQLDLIFRFAKEKRLPVAVHHHYKFGFDRALQFPVHSLEHITADAVLSDEDVLRLKDGNVAIVPTLTVAQSYLMEEAFDTLPKEYRTDFIENELKVRRDYFRNEARNHCNPHLHQTNLDMLKCYKTISFEKLWEKKKFLVNPDLYFKMMKNGAENVKKMRAAGVLIGCGIDAGMPFNYFGGMYREFEIFERLGFSNLEILQSATINNAKILQIDAVTGTLETGKAADIVAWDSNPLENISALRTPAQVFREGKMMYSNRDLVAEGRLVL